jgi:hypothetical protein
VIDNTLVKEPSYSVPLVTRWSMLNTKILPCTLG